MKTLRNILPILILVLTVSIAEAQKNKMYSAETNMKAYVQSNNPDDLLQAKQLIDEVVKHEKTIGFWKAWYTYGKVYQLLGTDSITKSADPTFLFHAFEGYTKIFELANGRIDKFTKEDIVNNLKNLSVAFYNNGIDSYNTKDFESSSNFFIGVTEIDEVLVQESGEGMPFAATCIDYAIESYISLGKQAMRAGELEKCLAIIQEAQQIFPGNGALMKAEINYYIQSDNLQEGMSIVQNAIIAQTETLSANPENQEVKQDLSNLYTIEGEAYFQIDSFNKAFTSFENAVTYNPENHSAQYNCGVALTSQWGIASKNLNDMTELSDEAYETMNDEIYLTYLVPALKFLEAAVSIKPDDDQYSSTAESVKQILGNR